MFNVNKVWAVESDSEANICSKSSQLPWLFVSRYKSADISSARSVNCLSGGVRVTTSTCEREGTRARGTTSTWKELGMERGTPSVRLGGLVVLRMYVTLYMSQLGRWRYPIFEIVVARLGLEPRTTYSTRQELNHYTITGPVIRDL